MMNCLNLKSFGLCVTVFYMVLLFSGCSTFGTYNPATGKKEFIAISTDEEIALGKQFNKTILEKEKLSKDTAKTARVEAIGQRIAAVSDRRDYKYHFFLIDKDELNAFAAPGGNIYLYSGLVDALGTDDRIAAVIAHEVGHCAAKHVAKKFQASIGFSLAQSLILANLGLDSSAYNLASLSSNAVMSIISSAYSRKDEYEADRLSVKYIYKAGYDLEGMVEALEILKKESKTSKGLLFLRSHPYLDDRIERVKEEIEKYSNY